MFEVKDIKKSYKSDFWAAPVEVLKDVSFSIGKGQVVGFLGANGAGKTTLIKIMMGFTNSNSGSVHFFDGRSFQSISSKVGYLPERPYFYPHLSGREMVEFMGGLCNLSENQIEKGIERYAHRLKIHFALERKIKGYSKGMLQRLGMLCTLLHNPELVILDEPLSGLDPQGRKDIKDLLLELSSEGKTIFFSSHIVSDVEEVCEKVVVLDKGIVVYDGDISELIQENSRSEYLITVDKKVYEQDRDDFKYVEIGSHLTYSVGEALKNDFIKNCLESDINILKLTKNSPTLEEVVYKTGRSI
ncbi:putative pilus-related ABC transporter ATP-binding subunit [Halobacteriovorax marinus SJ]|uniref:Pilus-related ABC transporter ATP-binding subunit n=1 Tax=Halobacteriovorax marinus (strain ATCC BAA-682 / DSM 15412 / SJ) TaxID=862908 RepID=E1X2A6_HALMS|nr:ABC transporter ATP-binding protein [Halobacteriovorax marinus]CBW25062.1 putative pilus-related ABC transporter ATP-binding subunit [Halobacteriovorax marinus SJ]